MKSKKIKGLKLSVLNLKNKRVFEAVNHQQYALEIFYYTYILIQNMQFYKCMSF